MPIIVTAINGIEREGEIIHDEGGVIEVCFEYEGWEHYGRASKDALHVHGQRLDPWYDLPFTAITWTLRRDLDNLETWE